MQNEKGKVTALDANNKAVKVGRHWYYATEQDLRRLRLDDDVEITFVTQEDRRKIIEIKLIIDGK